MANRVDPDQTSPSGFGTTLFAQVCLSKNLGSLPMPLITGIKWGHVMDYQNFMHQEKNVCLVLGVWWPVSQLVSYFLT